MIPDDCPACDRLVGVVCPAHCLGEHCRDSVHVDLCVGPIRNRQLELLHRHGVSITAGIVAAVLGAEKAMAEVWG